MSNRVRMATPAEREQMRESMRAQRRNTWEPTILGATNLRQQLAILTCTPAGQDGQEVAPGWPSN